MEVSDWNEGDGAPYDADSVAAILMTASGRYVLQRRDDLPEVDFPGYRGLFGGAIEPGESPIDALRRELDEELTFVPERLAPFATLVFDERNSGGWNCRRRFFEARVEDEEIRRMKVREGGGMDILDGREVVGLPAVIPYDLCAILMHERRAVAHEALAKKRARKDVTT